jgi:hypothetical protein
MEAILVALMVLALQLVPLSIASAPPIVMLVRRRAPVPALLLYVGGLGFLAAWVAAGIENIDWADRTGGEGSILAGAQWLAAAVLAAGGSIWWTLRRQRSNAVG